MKYKLVQRKNPQKPAEPGKWYPQAVNAGKVTVKQIVTDIAGRSSLTRGDINNVLDNFLDRLPAYLMLGHSVQLGSFGTIRLSVTGEGVDTKDKYNTKKMNSPKVIFTPGVDFKNSLDEITFELVAE